MTQLFAAVDATGNIRFPDEVPRGSACGCHCPECGSPLQARQGETRQWHFAHEPGQERPECVVGAVNLIRRIAVDLLRSEPLFELPAYVRMVSVRHLREQVSWKAQVLPASMEWKPKAAKDEPVATGLLDNGVSVSLFIQVAPVQPVFGPVVPGQGAQLVFWVPMPEPAFLRTMTGLRQHIRQFARVLWRHQPDVFGLIEKTRERLLREYQSYEARPVQTVRMPLPSTAAPEPEPARSSAQGTASEDRTYDWAPGRKPSTSFIFYRLRDGTAWIIYTRANGSFSIVPRPVFEGWDEFLPASIGRPNPTDMCYDAPALAPVLMFMSGRSRCTRTNSNPDEFEGL